MRRGACMGVGMNIVPLKPPKPEVNEDLVEILEDALARAKTGEINAGAIIVSDNECNYVTTAGIQNKWNFIGRLEHLKHTLLQ